ncbi:DUF3520 domain-containing protein [Flavobacterium sp. D33]|nr:DUF3520 domain-containing protein [Flavobacterium selenitireducens]
MLISLATHQSAGLRVLFLDRDAQAVTSQQITVTGRVSDSSGPLPGANVIVKETNVGVQTDVDGKYSIKVNQGETLVFSYIGMQDRHVKVGKRTTINVTLTQGAALSEVVVTGALGIQKEKSRKVHIRSEALTRSAAPTASPLIERDDNAPGIPNRHVATTTDDEEYGTFVENAFTSPKNEPLSTFSIDVDNASYTNVRRFLNNGQKIPKDAVRIEEMVNFFKYDYPQPTGEHPFAIVTEVAECPWNSGNKLVKIGLQGKQIETDHLPASNFVFLIDVSGSMSSYNKLPLLKASMKLLVAQMRAEDRVSMVVYAGAAGLVLPPTDGNEKERILSALDNLEAGGSTAGGAGIELAYKTASEHFIKNGNNRVILATDGDFNVGSTTNSDMEKLIEEKRKTGVFLTVLGYGMGNYKDSKMEILADKGNGNYAYIDNIQEANRFLVKEFGGSMYAIAKDVKIQVEFNPKHVQSYRLIGYENRKLRPEDFTNDAIDAGELGSGHNVTALYEVIPQGVKSTFFTESTNLKYTDQKNVDPKFKDELATVKFRYKKPDGEKSIEMVHVIGDKIGNASADMKFASAVAWFGLKLRESKLVANISSDDIRKLAKQGLSTDKDGYRSEFIRLVESVQTLGYAKN